MTSLLRKSHPGHAEALGFPCLKLGSPQMGSSHHSRISRMSPLRLMEIYPLGARRTELLHESTFFFFLQFIQSLSQGLTELLCSSSGSCPRIPRTEGFPRRQSGMPEQSQANWDKLVLLLTVEFVVCELAHVRSSFTF